jgi:2-polyprenyl-6-methoxyphenol hydroxylase-like FAD-dependent oxidoreductase
MSSQLSAPARVCIVGAGPVGALASLLWARQGAEVVLLEARPDSVRRLGGEWLHPAAIDVLSAAGVVPQIVRPNYPTGRGFVVVPEDGSEPIELAYAAHRSGTSVEHCVLVEALRRAAIEQPGVDYLPQARLTAIDGRTVEFVGADGATRRLTADLIVGADGRSSRVRQSVLGARRHRLVSCMAGVLLEGVSLPREGFGHVLVGAPGPMLAYRVAADAVRLCIDVPAEFCKTDDLNEFLAAHYAEFLPFEWREPFVAACRTGRTVWAKNEVEPRTVYGVDRVRLVGDAVGCLHPITAGGMTLGFQDAATLVAHPELNDYQHLRGAACRVPQALASSLYAALAGRDEPAALIRRAMYRRWRQSSAHRRNTVGLLCAEETNVWRYRSIFFRIGAMGMQTVLREIMTSQAWRHPSSAVGRIGRQLRWLDDRLVAGAAG